jgi:hypothetical protein
MGHKADKRRRNAAVGRQGSQTPSPIFEADSHAPADDAAGRKQINYAKKGFDEIIRSAPRN